MAQVIVPIKFTYQDYKLLPEEKRCELIEGEFFMSPAPKPYHQIVLGRLYRKFQEFFEDRHGGIVLLAPTDVVFSDEDVVQPDLLVIEQARFKIVQDECVRGAPDLIVEILSPTTIERDRVIKKKLYGRYGVREYWIVDPDAKTVEVLKLSEAGLETVRVYPQGLEVQSVLWPQLKIPLNALF
ncbi:MAG: Uma2 family endonuclease [Candidatus Bipolaricaulota bacterium]|nr:Uma2 family endonuclease [Candidatus Bipolaricaulota bacterium]MDW8140828.1 Uma2 family endonuclease [Candidatus Bipolaricaulota bacterium]